MSVAGRIFEAFRIIVRADVIKKDDAKKIRQTGTHSSVGYKAEGDVRIKVEQSKLVSGGRSDPSRPEKGREFRGSHARIVSRKKGSIVPDDEDPKRKKGYFSKDVYFSGDLEEISSQKRRKKR